MSAKTQKFYRLRTLNGLREISIFFLIFEDFKCVYFYTHLPSYCLFVDVDMPVQEHKSGVGVSYISVSSLSVHSLAR